MFWVRVKPRGGKPFDVEVTTLHALEWEEARPGRSISQFDRDGRISDLYTLTYVAVEDDGRFDGDIKHFKKTCVIKRIDPPADAESDDDVDPT